jgi:hypothetical protein
MPIYYYGVRQISHLPKHRLVPKTSLEAFVLRKKIDMLPPVDAIICKEAITNHPDELLIIAKRLLLEYRTHNFRDKLKTTTEEDEVKVGSIATHEDACGRHQAIIIDINNTYAWALFFNSKPHVKTRRATTEELALAGFVSKRPTYLNLVMRSVEEFVSCGIMFPQHRIQDFRKEYLHIE